MNLDELKKLCSEATPGDANSNESGEHILPPFVVSREDSYAIGWFNKETDANLFAAARTYMPKLIAVAELVEEFSKGKIDYGDLTTPTAQKSALEHMFTVMRQRARDALDAFSAVDSERTMKRLSAVAEAAKKYVVVNRIREDHEFRSSCLDEEDALLDALDALESE